MQRSLSKLLVFPVIIMAAAVLFPITSPIPVKVIPHSLTPVASTIASEIDDSSPTSNAHNVGARTCASSTCHGSPRPDTEHANMIRRDEYMIWLEQDAHARAY
ncbi:MAG: hypothetical protein HOB73_00725, partial [Planctomycetaceae bacterium]|nr:hypothetical protein [Planctomycetaceae bacterium]